MSTDSSETSAERAGGAPPAYVFESLGGAMGEYRGFEVPLSFGAAEAEHRVLRESCGLVVRPWFSFLEMRGEDRQRYLNGLVTCDVKELSPGRGTYGFITEVKGHVLADIAVLAREESLLLRLPPGRSEGLSAHLMKYVIVDRVELEPAEPLLCLTLHGPRAEAVLASALGAETALPEAAWEHRAASLAGAEARLVREPLGRAAGWTFLVPATSGEALYQALLALPEGPRPAGAHAWEQLRVEEGRPVFGVDFGPESFPQETGLEGAVSYTKGCYLGQEVVARIHYRGGVKRRLRGLLLEADGQEAMGAEVLYEGRAAGTLTSASGRLGLAILHARAGEPGTKVEVAGLGPAEVAELPFAGA